MADTRVVLLNGARQTGKSTLAQLVAGQRGGRYLTLDDPATAGLARSDPSAVDGRSKIPPPPAVRRRAQLVRPGL